MDQSQLLEAILSLGPDERARFARKIIASLDLSVEGDVSAAWVCEIERRHLEVQEGRAVLSDWDDVQKRIRANLNQIQP